MPKTVDVKAQRDVPEQTACPRLRLYIYIYIYIYNDRMQNLLENHATLSKYKGRNENRKWKARDILNLWDAKIKSKNTRAFAP